MQYAYNTTFVYSASYSDQWAHIWILHTGCVQLYRCLKCLEAVSSLCVLGHCWIMSFESKQYSELTFFGGVFADPTHRAQMDFTIIQIEIQLHIVQLENCYV